MRGARRGSKPSILRLSSAITGYYMLAPAKRGVKNLIRRGFRICASPFLLLSSNSASLSFDGCPRNFMNVPNKLTVS